MKKKLQFIKEFQEYNDHTYIEAKMQELSDLFIDTGEELDYELGDGGLTVSFNNQTYRVNIEELTIDNKVMTSMDEILDVIEKEVYSHLGISEKKSI